MKGVLILILLRGSCLNCIFRELSISDVGIRCLWGGDSVILSLVGDGLKLYGVIAI